jgi:hypothetical protein
MSAKPGKKSAKKSAVTTPLPVTTAGAASSEAVTAPPVGDDRSVPAIDAADPRRRRLGQFVLITVCLYVAALWLLAFDQTFNWGIFGPPLPPLP